MCGRGHYVKKKKKKYCKRRKATLEKSDIRNFHGEEAFIRSSPVPTASDLNLTLMADSISTKKAVQESYGTIARTVTSDAKATAVAEAFGYNREELSQLPEGANMGLSCGNPLVLASLKLVSILKA